MVVNIRAIRVKQNNDYCLESYIFIKTRQWNKQGSKPCKATNNFPIVGQWLFLRSPPKSHQAWILSSMRITDSDVCYCSFTPILHYIRYFEVKNQSVKNQSFPYGTFMII